MDPLNIENWQNKLSSVTFRTEFLNFTFKQAQALVKKLEDPSAKYKKFLPEHEAELSQLAAQIDAKIKLVDCGQGVFVRLSTRFVTLDR